MTGEPVTVVDDGAFVRATARLPGCTPDRALAAFTDPATLAQWWGGELSADVTPGGQYTVRFPGLGRAMTGEVLGYEPGSRLEFMWGWDNEPDDRRTVLVAVSRGTPAGETILTVRHGPYADSAADHAARAGHREGWEFFLPRLAALVSG